jgi:hypothetical protein
LFDAKRQASAARRHAQFANHEILVWVDAGKRGFVVGQKPDAVGRGSDDAMHSRHARGNGVGNLICLRIDAREGRDAAKGSPQTSKGGGHSTARSSHTINRFGLLVCFRIDSLDRLFAGSENHFGGKDPFGLLGDWKFGLGLQFFEWNLDARSLYANRRDGPWGLGMGGLERLIVRPSQTGKREED